ncbi:60s ribosomal protein l29-like, partial [Lynx pardinus]
ESVKGVDPKFWRDTHFAKKHKKGLKKRQTNNTKATSTCAEDIEAFVNPNGVKSKIPKGSSHQLNQLAYIAHPKLRKHACTHIAKGLRLCQPKAKSKAQTKAQAVVQALSTKGQGQGSS